MLRFLTAGESHGPSLTVIVEGLPSGLPVKHEVLAANLARRRLGYGRGPRMRFEDDRLRILGGVRHGRTLGSPVAIEIANAEWERKWTSEMSPDPGVPERKLTKPRPGHADLAGMLKYGFDDARDVLERASARETAARVVAGTLARLLIAEIGISVLSHVVQIGQAVAEVDRLPTPGELAAIDASEVRCLDQASAERMIAEIKAAAKVGDSLGGRVEVVAHGVPVGIGSHVHWDRKLDGLLAQAVMSIPAVKAVSIGAGIEVVGKRGSEAHDPIVPDGEGLTRPSWRAGGIEGGISNGSPIVMQAWMKPLATLSRPVLATVDLATGEPSLSFRERTDVVAVPAMGVVAEAMVAWVLATECQRKYGGDRLEEFVSNHDRSVASQFETPSAVGVDRQ
jgi:chorismate synthase